MKCWACFAPYEVHTSLGGGRGPEPGDVAVCFYCAVVGTYDEVDGVLALREPTDAELEVFFADERVIGARQMILKGIEEGVIRPWVNS